MHSTLLTLPLLCGLLADSAKPVFECGGCAISASMSVQDATRAGHVPMVAKHWTKLSV